MQTVYGCLSFITAQELVMKKSLVISMALVTVLSINATSAHAVWWWAGSAIKHLSSSDKKKEKKSYKERQRSYESRYGSERYDGYNPYHQHPDGERSPYYNEKSDKGW